MGKKSLSVKLYSYTTHLVMKSEILHTDFRRVHNDSWHKVQENVVAICADTCVAESHLQLIHGLQKKTFSLILKVLKRGFLVAYKQMSFLPALPVMPSSFLVRQKYVLHSQSTVGFYLLL